MAKKKKFSLCNLKTWGELQVLDIASMHLLKVSGVRA